MARPVKNSWLKRVVELENHELAAGGM